tara:strand:+ start:836 stop:1279 length:444 start_codon:yes stop_codon:yes gene_type:complete
MKDVYKLPWGEQLQHYRVRNKLTQPDIGSIEDPNTGKDLFPNANVSISSFETLRQGKVPPQLYKVLLISDKLNLSLEERFYFILSARQESASDKIKDFDTAIKQIKTEISIERKGVSKKMAKLLSIVHGLTEDDLDWAINMLSRLKN